MAHTLSNGLLETFATTAEAVAATTKKLEKAALLGAYFHTLADADLMRAARYFAGHQFPLSDARTTNVGTSTLRAALSDATGLDVENLRPRYVRLGDSGEVAFEAVMETRGTTSEPSITLADTEKLIEELSELRGIKTKQQLLAEVLARSTAMEAKYLVKLLSGDLRIGLKEGLVEDSIARAFESAAGENLARQHAHGRHRGDSRARSPRRVKEHFHAAFSPAQVHARHSRHRPLGHCAHHARRIFRRRQVRRHTRAGARTEGTGNRRR